MRRRRSPGRDEPFRSDLRAHLKGHSEGLEDLAVEMLARGLSVRDIEDAFREESGRLLLSRTAVSEMGERLWADYLGFAKRDLSEFEIAYLFVDGIAERLRAGQRREPVLAAWGFTLEGKKVSPASDGGLEGGQRDRLRVLPGHAQPRPGRSSPDRLRRRAWHYQGDRDLFSQERAPTLPRAPDEELGGEGARGSLAGVQGPRPSGLPGPPRAPSPAIWPRAWCVTGSASCPSAVACFPG